MSKVIKKEIVWGDRNLSIETGKISNLTDGAVFISYGETSVLCTVASDKDANEEASFFPLTVSYQEKFYASGKIPKGFLKREGRPSDNETLTSRLIDRAVRPCFNNNFNSNTQIICTVLSYDKVNNPDIISLIGAAAALAISGLPFSEILAAVRVGFINNAFVLNPSLEELKDSLLDLIVAGTESSIVMVESEASFLTEDKMLGALDFAHKSIQPVINLISEFKKEVNKPVIEVAEVADKPELSAIIEKTAGSSIADAYSQEGKLKRSAALKQARKDILSKTEELQGEDFCKKSASDSLAKFEKNFVRSLIAEKSKRIDGRGLSDIRPISSEVSYLPRTHGSALFTRGETQALVTTTLGTKLDMQIIDSLISDYKERFLLHYNFPPYSVGEVSPMRSVGRREIGHGKLAWRALKASLPSFEEFPYAIRVVSEVTSCNGSSSMATVCGSSLSLMDAGVPVKQVIAGIAMGLIKEGDKICILSDILGEEDHLGDMDFKVAGSEEGITSLQMDIKIKGINLDVIEKALKEAKTGRVHIINEMKKTLSDPRSELNENAPQIVSFKIDSNKIGDVIGSGGKVIKEICETAGVEIDIAEDGKVSVSALSKDSIDKAMEIIKSIVTDVEVGTVFDGVVKTIMDFGAVVKFGFRNSGMVHISEILNERIESVSSVLKVDDKVKVKVLSFDGKGKYRLSMKRVDQDTGEPIEFKKPYDKKDGNGNNDGNSRPFRAGGNRNSSRGPGERRDNNRGDSGNSPGFNKDKMWDDWNNN